MKGHSILSISFSKSKSKSNPGIFFLFGVAKDTIDEANVFSNKSTFCKTSLVVIDEIKKRRFQGISN